MGEMQILYNGLYMGYNGLYGCEHDSSLNWNILPVTLQIFPPECCQIPGDILVKISPYSPWNDSL